MPSNTLVNEAYKQTHTHTHTHTDIYNRRFDLVTIVIPKIFNIVIK